MGGGGGDGLSVSLYARFFNTAFAISSIFNQLSEIEVLCKPWTIQNVAIICSTLQNDENDEGIADNVPMPEEL